MDALIGFLIFGYVIYSIIKNSAKAAGGSSGKAGDFLGNIDQIIQTAYENTKQSSNQPSQKVKKYVPRKPEKKPVNSTISMNTEVSLDTDFAPEQSLESYVEDADSLESLDFTETSLESDSYSRSHNEKKNRRGGILDKEISGKESGSVGKLISFDSDSLVRGFVFKEIFDRQDRL